jgi:hypothetical protein
MTTFELNGRTVSVDVAEDMQSNRTVVQERPPRE